MEGSIHVAAGKEEDPPGSFGESNPKCTVRRWTIRPIVQTIQAILPDLCTFTRLQLVLLFCFGVISIIFSIVDFNALVHPDSGRKTVIKFQNDYDLYNMEYWRRVVMCLSGVCSFTGVLGVVLTTKRKRSNYFWGLINSILYGIYAFAYGYAGDAQLYIIYFVPMQIAGMYKWDSEALTSSGDVIVEPLSWKSGVFYFVLLWLVGICFYYEIPAFARALSGYYVFDPQVIGTHAPLILDASSNAFNLVAQLLNVNRHWQQWPAWITVNCIQIAMWSGISTFPADFNILFMWSLFLINSLCGFYVWFTSARLQHIAANNIQPAKTRSPATSPINSEAIVDV